MSVTIGFDAEVALQAALATEKAAIGSSSWIGTDGQLLDGVKIRNGRVTTETLIMNSVDGSVQRLRSDRPL